MKVVFVNRYYAPDISATSQMLTDLAEALAARGLAVEVVTSAQRYDDAQARLPASEVRAGVRVHRLETTRAGRSRLAGRALDYASFYLLAFRRLLALLQPGDVVVLKTDPPLLSLLGPPLKWLRGCSVVNWLQDLFPETAVRLGALPPPAAAWRPLAWLRDASLRAASVNVVIGRRMYGFLRDRGIPADRLAHVPNWADGRAIRPVALERSALRRTLGPRAGFVVMHSGNLGRAHDVYAILGAMQLLRGDASVLFLFVGGGHGLDALRAAVEAQELPNARFLPYQPRTSLGDALGAADVHLVSLRPELEGLIVPSKLYGILAAGRPAIFIGDARGEVATVLAAAKCGVTVPCGDGPGLAAQIRRLRDHPGIWRQAADNARLRFEAVGSVASAAAAWGGLLGLPQIAAVAASLDDATEELPDQSGM